MFSFGKKETKDLLISAVIITLIFVFDEIKSSAYSLISKLEIIGIYFVFIGLSFILHESAHKFTAKSRGAWSEFRMWKQGLLLSAGLRLLGGPIMIAPGATLWIKPFATREDKGLVSAAGPLTNIILAIIFWGLSFFFPLMKIGVNINLALALFNLFPFPPLDGYSIATWKPLAWIVLFGASFGLRFLL